MPYVVTCEVCGSTDATRISFGYQELSVVVDGHPTGVAEEIDVCAEHRKAALKLLVKHVVDTFEEQFPLHRDLHEIAGRRDAQAAVVRESARPLLEHEGRYAAARVVPDPPAALVEQHLANVAALGEIEQERQQVFRDATEKVDQRAAKFREALRK